MYIHGGHEAWNQHKLPMSLQWLYTLPAYSVTSLQEDGICESEVVFSCVYVWTYV